MGEISTQRIADDIEAIARFSESSPDVGYSRPTFSRPWADARDYVRTQAEQWGCHVRIDAAGNVHIRPASRDWQEPLWLSGSHLDSVPTGGKYDGVVGVVVPLEVLRVYPEAPLELVLFAEEEGTTFQLGMVGSHLWVGSLDPVCLPQLANREGQSYVTAGAAHGVEPARLPAERLRPEHYLGMIEVHVQQGLSLWDSQVPVGVVTTVHGRRQFQVAVQGRCSHAGATKMTERRDALAGTAAMLIALESLGRKWNQELDHTVVTVGRLQAQPNAHNVIAGRVDFCLDFRGPSDTRLDEGEAIIRQRIRAIAADRQLAADIHRSEALPVVPFSSETCDRLRSAAAGLGVPLPDVVSGALHDAAIVAPHLPTAMLFVASRDGISHDPHEFSRIEDIQLAARILAGAVMA